MATPSYTLPGFRTQTVSALFKRLTDQAFWDNAAGRYVMPATVTALAPLLVAGAFVGITDEWQPTSMPALSSDPHEVLFFVTTDLAFGGEVAQDVYPRVSVQTAIAPSQTANAVVTALNTQADGGVTGLTPTVVYARTIANGANVSPYVTVAEVLNNGQGTGDYLITYNAAQYGEAVVEST